MAFYPKELENLEQLNYSRQELGATESEQVGVDKVPADPLVWRLKLIERAALRVKKLYNAKLDRQASYQEGELVFDDKAKRFARVKSSLNGLSLRFLSREQGNEQAPQNSPKSKTLPTVMHPLAATGKSRQKLSVKISAKPISKSVAHASSRSKPKQVVKSATNHNKQVAASSKKTLALSSVKQRDDYIRTHYLKMGNKELARHTGLSEHTIRRKLGEWSLRRPTA